MQDYHCLAKTMPPPRGPKRQYTFQWLLIPICQCSSGKVLKGSLKQMPRIRFGCNFGNSRTDCNKRNACGHLWALLSENSGPSQTSPLRDKVYGIFSVYHFKVSPGNIWGLMRGRVLASPNNTLARNEAQLPTSRVNHGLSTWNHFNSDHKPHGEPKKPKWSGTERIRSPNAAKLEKKITCSKLFPTFHRCHRFGVPFNPFDLTEVLQDAQCGAKGHYSGFQDFMMQIVQ